MLLILQVTPDRNPREFSLWQYIVFSNPITVMRNFGNTVLFCAALLGATASYAAPRFKTEASQLSAQKRELLSETMKVLDDWSGENEKLVAAGVMIDSLIKSDPDFLPIYIEKARLAIMRGATGTNDFKKANRDALAIIAEVQKKDPSYPKSYVLAGHAFLNVEDFESARKSLERAERIGTSDPWLYNNFADLYGRMRQYDKALAYAKKALIQSKDNGKALVSAIAFISDFSGFTGHPVRSADISQLLFDSFKDPEQRMRIAVRLTGAYHGTPEVLDHAYEIIERQRKETPGLESADLALAEWFLAKGYWKTQNMIGIYDPKLSAAADKILDAVKPSQSANGRIFTGKFAIALGNGDIGKASELLKAGEAGDVPRGRVMAGKSLMMWLKSDYAEVIKIEEGLADSEPDFANESLLVAAYSRLGRKDMQAAYYKRQLERNPSAWTLGNYSHFLLFFMHDIDGAIVYGEKALKEMKYPMASNTTSLAYLMKASTLKRAGNAAAARKHVDQAKAIGFDEGYVFQYCDTYCADIQSLLTRP
ncbi:hypothetical protein [Duganella sp. Root336D2]|uniref:tetratricopeptide repeat protein n=1 Tax=Duganella sp. Root336D2 TaxID=1736518 RepID=UPI0012E3EEC8|nr:hypothetical protein [Duganella sp. Root336D2]